MAKCPDCDSVEINIFIDKGNGKCSECHGTGLGGALDQFVSSVVNERSVCEYCNGTKQCQTCGGTGLIDND